jgi:hypothetical protein
MYSMNVRNLNINNDAHAVTEHEESFYSLGVLLCD